MEVLTVRGQDWRPIQLGGPSNFHLDILNGKDTTIEWEDIYKGALLPYYLRPYLSSSLLYYPSGFFRRS